MEAAFREYGLPDGVRSDNGEPFASALGVGGLSRLSVWWIKLGIRPERIPRGKPQHNGRHEQIHRTLKAATAQPPASNMQMQQEAFDAFAAGIQLGAARTEALQMKTPGECYVASNRKYPSRLAEPEYGDGWEVRRVRGCGRMRWWSGNIFVGKALVREQVGLEPQDEVIWRAMVSTAIPSAG